MKSITTLVTCLTLIGLLVPFSGVLAVVRLPQIFGSRMVLQQRSRIAFWGWADPDELVRVQAGWLGRPVTARAGSDGRWQMSLKTAAAGGPYQLVVEGSNRIELDDILLGEVWLCSGQSNMEFTIAMLGGWPGFYQADHDDLVQNEYPLLRFFTVDKMTSPVPLDSCSGAWQRPSPDVVENSSAAAFFFGRELVRELRVPVGLVVASWGGTPAEAWTPLPALQHNRRLAKFLTDPNHNPDFDFPTTPAILYNGMINPLLAAPVRGVIWYQGESNRNDPQEYEELMTALIASWRRAWKSDLPFYFTQLAPFDYGDTHSAALIQEAQRQTLAVPHTGMAVTADIGDPQDIHPRNKRDVGRRLALWALARTYGVELPAFSGPLYRKMEREGRAIRIWFDHAEGGLQAGAEGPGELLIAGADRRFVPAEFRIEGSTLLVWSEQVAKPLAVRFAFGNTAAVRLYNRAGLPASPFRTDRWPVTAPLQAREYHVRVGGDDSNPGTAERPLATIQRAAGLAGPGDTITVHAGLYRERIDPPRGGRSDQERILYRAAPGERVEIKGSEAVSGWEQVQEGIWRKRLPNTFFKDFNPYSDEIRGDWFEDKGRKHHTGAVYLNGEWLIEAAALEEVLRPAPAEAGEAAAAPVYPAAPGLWFARVDGDSTTLWTRFGSADPNHELVEINVRRTVFYPSREGIDYLTVRGFIMRHAAAPWAPPTAEQIGLIGTHWSKGWIIEENEISHSVCSGVALGKHGDQWDNTSENSAEGYVLTIERALQHGWERSNIGGHILRNNHIHHCEQTGIVGSLGCAFSTVTGNDIHDIHVRALFSGAEMAAIKFHGAVDVVIRGNRIHHSCRGIWLDWMAQGTRVTGNLFHDNDVCEDLFFEVDHGPFVVDNNIFLSRASLLTVSQGGAYLHNLFAGVITSVTYDGRQTPWLEPHGTRVAGMHDNPRGDDRYYNNIFVRHGDMSVYDAVQFPVQMAGNIYLSGARPSVHEKKPLLLPAHDPQLRLQARADGLYLEGIFAPDWRKEAAGGQFDGALLGRTAIAGLPYENGDGSPLRFDEDFHGGPRRAVHPYPGPFESMTGERQLWKVWPR